MSAANSATRSALALEVHLGRLVVEGAGEAAGHVVEGAGVQLADGLVIGDGEAELFGDALRLPFGRAEEGGLSKETRRFAAGFWDLAERAEALRWVAMVSILFECAGGGAVDLISACSPR